MFGDVLDALKLLGNLFAGARKFGVEERERFARICDAISKDLTAFSGGQKSCARSSARLASSTLRSGGDFSRSLTEKNNSSQLVN
jgi:hypothetical protein